MGVVIWQRSSVPSGSMARLDCFRNWFNRMTKPGSNCPSCAAFVIGCVGAIFPISRLGCSQSRSLSHPPRTTQPAFPSSVRPPPSADRRGNNQVYECAHQGVRLGRASMWFLPSLIITPSFALCPLLFWYVAVETSLCSRSLPCDRQS